MKLLAIETGYFEGLVPNEVSVRSIIAHASNRNNVLSYRAHLHPALEVSPSHAPRPNELIAIRLYLMIRHVSIRPMSDRRARIRSIAFCQVSATLATFSMPSIKLVEKKATDFTDYTERRSLWSAFRKTTPAPPNPCNPWLDSVRAEQIRLPAGTPVLWKNQNRTALEKRGDRTRAGSRKCDQRCRTECPRRRSSWCRW